MTIRLESRLGRTQVESRRVELESKGGRQLHTHFHTRSLVSIHLHLHVVFASLHRALTG